MGVIEAKISAAPRFARSRLAITAAEEADIHAGLFAGLENGTLRPVIGKELLLAEAARAHKEILEPGTLANSGVRQ